MKCYLATYGNSRGIEFDLAGYAMSTMAPVHHDPMQGLRKIIEGQMAQFANHGKSICLESTAFIKWFNTIVLKVYEHAVLLDSLNDLDNQIARSQAISNTNLDKINISERYSR